MWVHTVHSYFTPAFLSCRACLSFPMATAEPAPAWWKLTFLRKKKSEPKVLYEIPAEYTNTEATPGAAGPQPDDSQFNARLERIVDKTATKGRHVKVSHSGRFKEKKRIRSTLAENPELFPNSDPGGDNESTGKWGPWSHGVIQLGDCNYALQSDLYRATYAQMYIKTKK